MKPQEAFTLKSFIKKETLTAPVPDMIKSMKARNYLGDAMTAVSINIIVNITGMVNYFYTDIIGLAAGAVGTAILVARLLDAFSDVGMGVLVDRTKSRYGKARPWLLRMALPAFLTIALLFTIPAGAGTGVKLAYVGVTNTLMLAVVYTAIAVPSGSLLSLETKNPVERSRMGMFRLVFAYAAGMSVSSLIIPAANRLGGGQQAWIKMSLIYGAVCALSLVAVFFLVRENNTVHLRAEGPKTSFLKGIGFLFKNKYWVIALVVNTSIQVIYSVGGSMAYYVKYILGNEELTAILGLYRLAAVGIGFVLSNLFVKRLGKRNLILIGSVVTVIGCVLRMINPYHVTLNLAAICITTLGGVPALAVIGAMVADSIEYGEWKTGKRAVGLASSSHSFAGKLGSAVFAGVGGWLLQLSGYNGMLPVQTPAANNMIMFLNIHLQLICHCIVFVLMLFYRLDKDYGRIMADLEARRKSR